MSMPDLLSPTLSDNPAEWGIHEPYDPATDLMLDDRQAQRHPEAASIERAMRAAGIISPAEYERRQHIARSRWFLLRNNVLSERSAITGRVESHWTFQGLPLPYCGLDAVIAAIQRHVDPEARLPELVQAKLGELVAMGDIEPITTKRAKDLCAAIYLKTRGRVDLWKRSQQRASPSNQRPFVHNPGRSHAPTRGRVRPGAR